MDAYKRGCMFDAWTDYFKADVWEQALEDNGVSKYFYNYRKRGKDEIFPWDFIDCGVTKTFLQREWEKALEENISRNCREKCQGCGAGRYGCGVCVQTREGEEAV